MNAPTVCEIMSTDTRSKSREKSEDASNLSLVDCDVHPYHVPDEILEYLPEEYQDYGFEIPHGNWSNPHDGFRGDAKPETGGIPGSDPELLRKHVMEEIHASLDRLGTDYVDLSQIHRWDENTPVEETLRTLDTLVDRGTVLYVGASSMAGWRLMKAPKTSDVENYERFVSMQPAHSLVNRHEEANVLPVCADENIGVVPWSPLARGFLAGKYERHEPIDAERFTEDRRPEDRFPESTWEVLDRVRSIADDRDATPAQVSLAWLLHKDVVDAPIIGPRRLDHLEENVGALTVSLTDEELARLEAPVTPAYRGGWAARE